MSESPQPAREMPSGIFATLDGLDYAFNPVNAPDRRPHLFSYHITIHNHSDSAVTVLARKWILTYENGEIDVIEGEKVIGKSPTLQPGQSFSYSSFHLVPMNAHARGTFHGVSASGEQLTISLPAFALSVPEDPHDPD
ncbi:MAG: ApaG domain [Oceanipulchritudo sp.]